MIPDVEGGPGWVIRSADLRPAITDADAFRAGIARDPLAGAIELLWSGDAAAALAVLEATPPSLRVRALRADCVRDLGDPAAAVTRYDELVAETENTPREAVIRQHRGKALLAAGRVDAAIEDFVRWSRCDVTAMRRCGPPQSRRSPSRRLVSRRVPLAARR